MANEERSPTVSNETTHPVVCTLTTKQASQQLIEWQDLQDHADQAVAIHGGARLTFPASMASGIQDLAERERSCCAFLAITTSVEEDRLTLEVTSANPDALPVISMIAGIPLP